MYKILLLPLALCLGSNLQAAGKPNIVYIMSDELAYFELSHMGNKYLETPNIDRMAAEGIRFTQALAGAPVCAPTRCTLMTGKHSGHASVRANGGGTPMRAGETTIASMLKKMGYATGGFGKWGCGGRGSTGVPEELGFDTFVGYYDQVHAHSFYPPHIVHNSKELPLEGNSGGRTGKTYSHYVIFDAAKKFIRDNAKKPFFCYLPITPPHGMYDIPESDPSWQHFKDKDWPGETRNYAAMVHMVDRQVGEVFALLKELGLEDNTLVFFCGDNGGSDRFRNNAHPRGFFSPNLNPMTGVGFRGGKGNLYEGGLRIPMLARWPGKIKPGRVSDLLWYFPDVLPTVAEVTGGEAPTDIDGISVLPELLGREQKKKHELLYWEYGGHTAVRMGNWKAVRTNQRKKWELYDLSTDLSESKDVVAKHPAIIEKMAAFAKASHVKTVQGKYSDTEAHEKDRWAKWGNARPQPRLSAKMKRLPKKGLLASSGWKLASFSSESTTNNRKAVFAIDGKPQTHWHTRWTSKHPHELVIDLGAQRTVRGLRYLARQDGSFNGGFKDFDFTIGDTPGQFGEPTLKGAFKKTKEPQEAACKATKGRYVRIRALSEVGGGPWASASEIGIIGE